MNVDGSTLSFFCSGDIIFFYWDEERGFSDVSILSNYLSFYWLGEHGEIYNLSGNIIRSEILSEDLDFFKIVKDFLVRERINIIIMTLFGLAVILIK